MLTEKQIERMLSKLRRFEETLEPMIFQKADAVGAAAYETTERLHEIPADALFHPVEPGFRWGGEGAYCWFKTSYTVPAALDGKDLFIRPYTEGYETMLWVDGVPFGTFATKIVFTGHGNHYCDLLRKNAKAGETIEIALEVYAGHSYKGCMPLEEQPLLDYNYHYQGIDVCVKDAEIQEFYFDLRAINELTERLPETSFRRGDLINALYEVHNRVLYAYADTDDATFRAALRSAQPFLKEMLAVKNGPEATEACVIGHSHMDTAWLWHVPETVKKCARTYANQIALMEQYPEYKFIQSSSCHSDFIRRYYPALFERIQAQVAAGRYEPNGGVWVECDCNITSGESMVRQFLWGQRFTRKYFSYTSNCFWLPDTFGYSAAIPQIMKGCGVEYFLTTKIAWNDTNRFPYDTFYWEGIDGTKVFTHFNRTHIWPGPKGLIHGVSGDPKRGDAPIMERSVSRRRIIAYGYGDGGGGPQFEMIEMARRCADLNGCPKAKNVRVGDYMQEMEAAAKNPATYKGELYLELHRGTLTNQHQIKRNNRKAELALRDLELLTVDAAVKAGKPASEEAIAPLYEKLLINQFHDILPGTCIPAAHKQSRAETGWIIETARKGILGAVTAPGSRVTLTNTLSFDRCDPVFLPCDAGLIADLPCKQQRYTDPDGTQMLIISGVTVPAFSTVSFDLIPGEPDAESSISLTAHGVETPFAAVTFNEKGYMASFVDKRMQRELCGGLPLGAYLMAEDVPSAWDNWDVDADIETKFADTAELLERKVVSHGAAALIIRSVYRISPKSTVTQDQCFFADTAEVRYDVRMDWQDDHRFLKTAFDTTLQSDFARFEIQFGHVLRPTTRNQSLEKAKFEVVNHKFTDLSETRAGAAILNDGKYAITAEGGKLRLSLHKGGTRPDFEGDHGLHKAVFSFLPHAGGFCAESVVRPAYALNVPVVVGRGDFALQPLAVPQAANVIVETVKPCEDAENACIVRLYEAEGTYTVCPMTYADSVKKIEQTNMLEETQAALTDAPLTFRPFEIKTIKLYY